MTFIFLSIIFIIPCCFAETWYVYVYTGNERFAGTDSNVYIRLSNSEGGNTNEYQLTHSNWMPEKNEFPVRNLFETGARERFLIQTDAIGDVASIQIRHNNYPVFQADWLLDQVIIQRNRDGAKYIFKCNCWLRKNHPYITLFALPDPRSIDKNKTNKSSSKFNRVFVVILILLIAILIGIFCCYNDYRRRQRRHSSSLNNTIEQIQQEPPLLDTYCQSLSRPPSPSSAPHFWMSTIRRWKNFRQGLPPDDHTRIAQSAAVAVPTTTTITATEEPPAYEDLYPNSTVSINTPLNSNS